MIPFMKFAKLLPGVRLVRILLLGALIAGLTLLSLHTSKLTNAQTATGNLAAPTLSAALSRTDAVALSWTAVPGAVRYELWAWTSATDWQQLDDGTLTGTSHTHDILSPGTTYYYTVRAVAANGTAGDWSQRKTVTVPGTSQAPAAPTLSAAASGTNTTNLNWNAVSGAVRYELWAWTNASGWQQLDDGNLTGTSHTHHGLTNGTTYYYTIRAVAAGGAVSSWSEYANATASSTSPATPTPTATQTQGPSPTPTQSPTTTHTPTAGPTQTPTPTPIPQPVPGTGGDPGGPAAPVLTTTAGVNWITLYWEAVTGASMYDIRRRKGENGTWERPSGTPQTTTAHGFLGLDFGTTYYYIARSIAADGKVSDWSNLVQDSPTGSLTSTSTPTSTATVTNTPTAGGSALAAPRLTAEATQTNAIELSWAPVPGAVRYILWTWTEALGWQRLDQGNLTGTVYTHINLTPGTTYYYAIHAINANGAASPWSDYPSATVPNSAEIGPTETPTETATPTETSATTLTPSATATSTETSDMTLTPTATATARPPAPGTERAALVALYNATNGPNWTHNDNWLSQEPISTWHGVFTDSGGHVSELILKSNKLTGSIPDLGALNKLTRLDLSYNDLSGSIPDLSALAKLTTLDLAFNELTGQIPDLSNLKNLRRLELEYNELSGQIPDLNDLAELWRLNLSGNELSGQIPDLSNLTSLWWLLLSGNKLSGPFPDLSDPTTLRWLSLSNNELSGPFPDLSALTNLAHLSLSSNNYSGNIPDLSSLTELRTAHLGSNQLTGTIPDLSALKYLEDLYLDANQLTGPIPDLSALTNLTNVNLASNQLTGQIPDLSALTNLTGLELHSNDLSGAIPDLSPLTQLDRLNLGDNQLTGPILNLNHLTSLRTVILRDNQLQGPFPDLSLLPNLRALSLTGNQLCLPQGFSLAGSNTVVVRQLNSLNLPTCTNAETMLTPAVPQDLEATVGTGQVVLSWSAVSNAAGYELRAWDSFDRTWNAIGGALTTATFTHTVQTDGRNYYYQVRARDANDVRSAWSDRVYAAVVPTDFPPPPVSLGFDLYFQKYLNVAGVVVVAPGEVSDAHMVQSREIITGMVSNRSDLLSIIAANNTRIFIESDRRGAIANPNPGSWTVYMGSNDPYCSTFVHEFAHLVHYAIDETAEDQTFNTRLRSLYQAALNAGRWSGLYASSNYREYWAELVSFWFQGAMPSPLNASYSKLEDYDPDAADLINETFGESATVPETCKP